LHALIREQTYKLEKFKFPQHSLSALLNKIKRDEMVRSHLTSPKGGSGPFHHDQTGL